MEYTYKINSFSTATYMQQVTNIVYDSNCQLNVQTVAKDGNQRPNL